MKDDITINSEPATAPRAATASTAATDVALSDPLVAAIDLQNKALEAFFNFDAIERSRDLESDPDGDYERMYRNE